MAKNAIVWLHNHKSSGLHEGPKNVNEGGDEKFCLCDLIVTAKIIIIHRD